jgi:hypothetical protein
MFVCDKRIERDGRLVCFEGQTLTDSEAEALGLLSIEESEKPVEAPTKSRKTKKAE